MTLHPARSLLVGLVAASWFLALAIPAGAQDADQPSLAVEPGTVAPGDPVAVTVSGFRARNVTLTVCGNAAARGSVDCNQAASEGLGLRTEVTQREYVVHAPPMPCPCVLRVASRTQDEVAVAPIDLIGHPVGEVVRSDTSRLIDVSIEARRAPEGVVEQLRSALGGPTRYEVEVTVRNRSGLPLDGLVVTAAARRGATDVGAEVDLPEVGLLAPGASWSHASSATVPAPVLGDVVWEARASGAGPVVAASSSSRPVPYLLVVLVALLVGDLVAIASRRAARRKGRRAPAEVVAAA